MSKKKTEIDVTCVDGLPHSLNPDVTRGVFKIRATEEEGFYAAFVNRQEPEMPSACSPPIEGEEMIRSV